MYGCIKVLLVIAVLLSTIQAITHADTVNPVAASSVDANLPPGYTTNWGQEPVVNQTDTRANIVLNGIWKFRPAISSDVLPDARPGWGYAWVPGNWRNSEPWSRGGIDKGLGSEWNTEALDTLDKGWYERPLTVPIGWHDRRVLIHFDRIGTDAEVYLGSHLCGMIASPTGDIDLTPFMTPGQTQQLSIYVVAVQQSPDPPIDWKFDVWNRGITGNVILYSQPMGTYISGIFIQTSVRKKYLSVGVDVHASGMAKANVLVSVQDDRGRTVLTLPGSSIHLSNEDQTLKIGCTWENPILWDYNHGYLYWLTVTIKGKGFHDNYRKRFGFREFRVEGRQFLLNEKPFRLRPTGGDGYTASEIAASIQSSKNQGFNCWEIWPNDNLARGFREQWKLIADIADKNGWPLIYPLPSIDGVTHWRGIPDEDHFKWWQTAAQLQWKEIRNHPSIVILQSTGNRWMHNDDLNPKRIGNTSLLYIKDVKLQPQFQLGNKVIDALRELDSTRVLGSHSAGPIGDYQSANTYLGWIPLQEREDWLSQWAISGDKPFSAIEFGTPLLTDFMRGRMGFGPSMETEPLYTEYAAAYLGPQVYKDEPSHYRQSIPEHFLGGQKYQGWYFNEDIEFSHSFQKIQSLFIENTWRSWRTLGITGGLLPWDNYRERSVGWQIVKNLPYKLGSLGEYTPESGKHVTVTTPSGKLFQRVNAPTLAWICGPIGSITSKDHHFYSGTTVRKAAALINDERSSEKYSLQWTVAVGSKIIVRKSAKGSIAAGTTALVDINFCAPSVSQKTKAILNLDASIGGHHLTDALSMRLFPRLVSCRHNPILILDREGSTKKLLVRLGWNAIVWDGKPHAGKLLVIGRNSLQYARGKDINLFASSGGHVVVFGQDPGWIRTHLGLRVSHHVTRRVWPVSTQSATSVLSGFDPDDFRDWNGSGTLIPSTSETNLNKPSPDSLPTFGWHWGNHGSVSSAPLEKPHYSGWRPLLECEFDLAYTPLMERSVGSGNIVLCTLDLEGRTVPDPVADLLTSRLLDYAKSWTPMKRTDVFYMGDDRHAKMLSQMGLAFETIKVLPEKPCLVIVEGNRQGITDDQFSDFLKIGGNIIFLPCQSGRGHLGVAAKPSAQFSEAVPPSWSVCRGLSASDLHLRTDLSVCTLSVNSDGSSWNTKLGAGGIFALSTLGHGSAVDIQLSPDMLNSDQNTYFRFTAWRLSHLLCVIAANLGASFDSDAAWWEKPGCSYEGSRLYDSDYRVDFDLGDDPERYFRW